MSAGDGCCGNCDQGLPCCSEGAVFTDQAAYTSYGGAGGTTYYPDHGYTGAEGGSPCCGSYVPMTGHLGGGLLPAEIPLYAPGMPDYAIPQAEIFATRGYCGTCQGVGITPEQKAFQVQGLGQASSSSSSSVNWQGWAMAFAVLGISVAAGYGLAHVIRR